MRLMRGQMASVGKTASLGKASGFLGEQKKAVIHLSPQLPVVFPCPWGPKAA